MASVRFSRVLVTLSVALATLGCSISLKPMDSALQETVNDIYVVYADTAKRGAFVRDVDVEIHVVGDNSDTFSGNKRIWYTPASLSNPSTIEYFFELEYKHFWLPKWKRVSKRYPNSGMYSISIDPTVSTTNDIVHVVGNTGGDAPKLIVDGRRTDFPGSCEIQRGVVYDGSPEFQSRIAIGNYRPPMTGCGAANHVVFGYSKNEAMVAVATAGLWTDTSGDVLTLDMTRTPIDIPVTVWVLNPSATQPQNFVQQDITSANDALFESQCGFQLVPTIVDKTGDPDTPNLLDVDTNEWQDLRTRIGYERNAINVYYVNTYTQSSGFQPLGVANNEVSCDLLNDCYRKHQAIVTNSRNARTLAHEIGHTLSLSHSAGDPANLMAQSYYGDAELYVGQCIKANFGSISAIQNLDLRPYQNLSLPLENFDP